MQFDAVSYSSAGGTKKGSFNCFELCRLYGECDLPVRTRKNT